MSRSLEGNKIVGAGLAALLVTVAIGHFGNALFHVEVPEQVAFPVSGLEVTEPDGGEPVEEAIPSVLPLLAAADVANGEAVARKCQQCHIFDQGESNKPGPSLWEVVNRPAGSVAGYGYSDAMAAFGGTGGVWSYDNLNHFLLKPRDLVAGTKMTFGGLPDLQDRADLIAYLRSLAASPAPLPTDAEIQAAQGGEGAAPQQ